MPEWLTPQNVFLLIITLLQVGQWIQKQLNSDATLGSKIVTLSDKLDEHKKMAATREHVDNISNQLREIRADHASFLSKEVYEADCRSTERRMASLERRVFNGSYNKD